MRAAKLMFSCLAVARLRRLRWGLEAVAVSCHEQTWPMTTYVRRSGKEAAAEQLCNEVAVASWLLQLRFGFQHLREARSCRPLRSLGGDCESRGVGAVLHAAATVAEESGDGAVSMLSVVSVEREHECSRADVISCTECSAVMNSECFFEDRGGDEVGQNEFVAMCILQMCSRVGFEDLKKVHRNSVLVDPKFIVRWCKAFAAEAYGCGPHVWMHKSGERSVVQDVSASEELDKQQADLLGLARSFYARPLSGNFCSRTLDLFYGQRAERGYAMNFGRLHVRAPRRRVVIAWQNVTDVTSRLESPMVFPRRCRHPRAAGFARGDSRGTVWMNRIHSAELKWSVYENEDPKKYFSSLLKWDCGVFGWHRASLLLLRARKIGRRWCRWRR